MFVFMLLPICSFAEEQKVCRVHIGIKVEEKIEPRFAESNCQKGDTLVLTGSGSLETAAYTCATGTIATQKFASVCEYIGHIRGNREGRRTKD